MVHLHSRQRDGNQRPVLSGTSLAGSLRARARRIAEVCCPVQADALVEGTLDQGAAVGEITTATAADAAVATQLSAAGRVVPQRTARPARKPRRR